MKKSWKLIIGIIVLLVVVSITIDKIAANMANKQLRKIQEQFSGQYDFSYEKLNVRLLKKDIVLKNFKFFSIVDSSHSHNKFDFELDKLHLHLDGYFNLVLDGTLDISKIEIIKPKVSYGLKKHDSNTDVKSQIQDSTIAVNDAGEKFLKFLKVEEFVLEDGNADIYRLEDPDMKIFYVDDLDIIISDINLDFENDSIFEKTKVSNFDLSASNVYNNDLENHKLSIGNISYSLASKGFAVNNLHVKNKQDPSIYNSKIKYRSPWISVDVEKIEFDIYPWEIFKNGVFDLGVISLTKPNVELFIDLNKALNPKIKPMPSRIIRDIPIDFNIDSIQLVDATFVFKAKSKGEKPGMLKISPINGNLTNITNTPDLLDENPIMKLDVETKLWDEGIVDLEIEVDINDINDKMHVDGKMINMPFVKAENMIKNMFGVEVTSGYIDLLEFQFDATDVYSEGKVVLNYHDLVLDLKKKDKSDKSTDDKQFKEKSNHFINFAVHGAIIKDNIPGDKKYTPVGYIMRERIRDKAFADAIWGSIQDGIFDIIIIDALYNSKNKYKKQIKKEQKAEEKSKKKEDKPNSKNEKHKLKLFNKKKSK